MNELNPLLYALNDIDTRYIIEPKRKKRPIALMIAAAAAAMTLLVGFTVYNRGHHILAYDKGSFEINVTLHDEVIVPEEYKSYRNTMYTMEDITAEEMFEMFNVKPLITDKFEYTDGDRGPEVGMGDVTFRCSLYNKTINREIRYFAKYIFDNYDVTFSSVELSNAKDYKFVKLNDGSRAVIADSEIVISAHFAYDGVKYDLYMLDGGTIDDMEQVLSDLGIV
ncbi:MAG: hypothetical protein HDT43_12040 [Ruminococcaceae bacterium]|nr:hypothetical protein [Oscillospiraceae bacterium]